MTLYLWSVGGQFVLILSSKSHVQISIEENFSQLPCWPGIDLKFVNLNMFVLIIKVFWFFDCFN